MLYNVFLGFTIITFPTTIPVTTTSIATFITITLIVKKLMEIPSRRERRPTGKDKKEGKGLGHVLPGTRTAMATAAACEGLGVQRA